MQRGDTALLLLLLMKSLATTATLLVGQLAAPLSTRLIAWACGQFTASPVPNTHHVVGCDHTTTSFEPPVMTSVSVGPSHGPELAIEHTWGFDS